MNDKSKSRTTISDQLRRAMVKKSAYELQRLSGVNNAAILRFKSGQRSLTLETVDKLAAALGLKLCRA